MTSLTPLTSEDMRVAGLRAVRKSELARERAAHRARQIEADARWHLRRIARAQLPWLQRWRTRVEDVYVDERLVQAVASVWTSEDGAWGVAVSDNRWYLTQAAAYGANR